MIRIYVTVRLEKVRPWTYNTLTKGSIRYRLIVIDVVRVSIFLVVEKGFHFPPYHEIK